MQTTFSTEQNETPSSDSRSQERITRPFGRVDTKLQGAPSREPITVPLGDGTGARPGAKDLPSGTITFLFTDVEGSTRLWERVPDAANRALMRHDALIETCVTNHA